ncbi:MAG: hypothetical protein IJ746_05435 [Ruminococcus sp.]|nr:hypothetical protein [Ruminococcus sp.]
MFRFFKLFGSQYLGFWILGVVFFIIQETPYMVMPLFKLGSDPLMHMEERSRLLDVLEKIMGSSCIALMALLVREDAMLFSLGTGQERLFFGLAAAVLLLNFFGWGLYFAGHQSLFVIMTFLVVMPPLYYVFIGLWRQNYILAVCGAAFLAVHFIHVYGNLKNTI